MDLHKRFESRVAVAGVSFEIRSGEVFGLLGPNGAGKSTTIKMLCGLLVPDQGRVEVHVAPDASVLSPATTEARKRIGVAPQALALYENLTGAENLAFFAQLYSVPTEKRAARVAWALDFAGLSSRGQDLVKTYSGGMARRLNLACALVHEPALVLLDEPTAGVDPQSRNHLFENVEALAKSGVAVLYTTHYLEEAERLCARAAIMDQGKILALDTISELIKQHGGAAQVEAELEAGLEKVPSSLPHQLKERTLRFEAAEPLLELAKLTEAGVKIRRLRVDQPSLESVFLKLTGRALRD